MQSSQDESENPDKTENTELHQFLGTEKPDKVKKTELGSIPEIEPLTNGIGHHEPPTVGNEDVTLDAELSDLIPTPPDGGWGWVIVFTSFMNHFILDGICYAFATLLKAYAEYFDSSSATTGAIMSTLIGCYLLSAPLASALVNKFGCRPVGMVGAGLASAAFVLSTMVTTVDLMILVLGVLGGLGFGLMYLPAVVSVSLYFEKKRAIAIGIAMCGTGIGTFTFGPLGEWLLEQTGDWKTVHFIFASVVMQGIVINALVRPLRPKPEQRRSMEARLRTLSMASEPEVADTPTSPTHRSLASIRLHRSSAYLGTAGNCSHHPTPALLSVEQAGDLSRPLYKKDIFYSGSIFNLKEYQDSPNIKDYTASVVTMPAMREDETHRVNPIKCSCLPSQMSDVLKEMLDFSLFTNVSFNIIFVAILVIMLAYFIPYGYTADRASKLGVEDSQASFLISVLGISTMVGRLAACGFAQIPNFRSITLHNVFLFGSGLAAMFVPLCDTYVKMAVAAFFYGLFMGGHVSLSPIVLVDILGLQKLTTSFGLMTLGRGISTLAGPPLAGYLYDSTNSHDASFYMAGGLIIFSTCAFCLLELSCINRREKTTSSTP